MKTQPFIATGIAAFLLSPLFAIDTPADNSPPPAAADSQPRADANAPEITPEKKADTAYLGILSEEVPAMLSEHLNLKPDEGVAVKALAQDGPADKAGISANDIITRAADKPVGFHQDLTEIVRSLKPGDILHLDTIHKGKPRGIDITLGTRPEGIDEPQADPLLGDLPLAGVPKEMADRIRGAIKGNIGGIQLQLGNAGMGALPPEKMEQMKKQMEKIGGMKGMFNFEGGAFFRIADADGSIEMKTTKDGKEITLRDKDDKVTWSGPWDTEQDKAAAPADVRDRINHNNINGMGPDRGMPNIIPEMLIPEQIPDDTDSEDDNEDASDKPK